MKKYISCLLSVAAAMLLIGCSSEPEETTVKIDGLEAMTQALQNNAMLEMKPAAIDLGDKHLLYIPVGNTRDGNFSIEYKFYELVDGELKQVGFVQPDSGR